MDIRTGKIKYLIFHHTAGHEKNTEAVRQEHIKGRGFGDIGYNSVIESDGTIGKGRDVKWASAADPGKAPGETQTMNQLGFHISSIGNFMTDTMSENQYQSLLKEAIRVARLYQIPVSRFRRHKDQSATSCPGDNFPWARLISDATAALQPKPIATVVWYYGEPDKIPAQYVAAKVGSKAILPRSQYKSGNKDIIVGGSAIPGAINLTGATWVETMEAVLAYLKGVTK